MKECLESVQFEDCRLALWDLVNGIWYLVFSIWYLFFGF